MKPSQIAKAIKNLVPTGEFSFNEIDVDSLIWYSEDSIKPTKEAILLEVKKVIENEPFEAKKVENDKAALLVKLGITAEEAKLLLS